MTGAWRLMRANMPMMHWCRLKVLDAVPPTGWPMPFGIQVMQPVVTSGGQALWVKDDEMKVYPDLSSAQAPGMTDLMVPPETIDDLEDMTPPDPAFMQKVAESQHAIDTAAAIEAPVSFKSLPAPPLPKLVIKLRKPGKEGG